MTGGRWLIMVVLTVLVLGSGCTLYRPRPVTFRVRDGDTGQPIANARVRADYFVMFDFGVWFASVGPREGGTDRDGKLTLVIDPHKPMFLLQVTADDYPEGPNSGRLAFGSSRWGRSVPGPWYSLREDYEVRLYRGAQPTADLTVPDGYRGPVLVRFATDGDPPVLNGQRAFPYTASARGVVTVADGGFFEAVGSFTGVRARYADRSTFPTYVRDRHDPAAPKAPTDDAVAMRFITPVWKRHTWLYVLGTAAEADAVNRAVWTDDNHFDEAAFERIVKSHEPPTAAPQR